MAEVIQTELFGICFACPEESRECNPLMCNRYYRWAVATTPEETSQKRKRKKDRDGKGVDRL